MPPDWLPRTGYHTWHDLLEGGCAKHGDAETVTVAWLARGDSPDDPNHAQNLGAWGDGQAQKIK